MPAFQKPQLATLVDHVPAGNQWPHELKYDGYRCLLAKSGDQIRAYTRSGLDWSEKFHEIVASAPDIDADSALLDGEIVWLGPEGRPDFSGLQAALKRSEAPKSERQSQMRNSN